LGLRAVERGLGGEVNSYLPLFILLVYAILVVIYSVATPMFEAPDEEQHFGFVQHLTQAWDLPEQHGATKTPWGQEASQPPLYYLLGSLVARLVPADYDPYPLALNPHAEIGIGLAQLNRNTFAHTPDEAFPWHGVALRLHLVRLFSAILGGFSIYAVYRTARLALPDMPIVALVAMAFTAFNPMFLFLSASVNNDNLVTLFGTLASWLMMLLIQRGTTWQRIVLLAIVLALASLSKLSGLTLYPVVGVLLIFLLIKQRLTWRQLFVVAGIIGGSFIVLASWWYLRNLQLYGDVTGLNAMIAIVNPRKVPYTITTMLNEMQGLRISFWALFGWFNVIGPIWFLTAMDILTVIALIGGVWWVWRSVRSENAGRGRPDPYKKRVGVGVGPASPTEMIRNLPLQGSPSPNSERGLGGEVLLPIGILGLQFLVAFASLINWTRITPGTQGRLLFPALAAIATLAALGWTAAARALRRESLVVIPVALMAGVAILIPFLTIAPAYAAPPVVAKLPDGAISADARFGKIEVVGFQIDRQPIQPGGQLPITVYYRGDPYPRNLSLYLTALGPDDQPIGKVDSYPGGGNLPTSAWTPATIYADRYAIPISAAAVGPAQFRIEFGWWDFATKERVKATHADGSPLDALILRGGTLLATSPAPEPGIAQAAVFSGALKLKGYTLSPANGLLNVGDTLSVALDWQGLSQVYEDFTVFVHLEDSSGKPIVQDDAPPLRGSYPTSAWAVGIPLVDIHSLKVTPPGTYRLVIGLYRPRDNSRLPVDLGGDSLTLQTPITVK
ncbi:MAG: glycosyltransferase family 39 protein, partial [Chloroflexota bacterium]